MPFRDQRDVPDFLEFMFVDCDDDYPAFSDYYFVQVDMRLHDNINTGPVVLSYYDFRNVRSCGPGVITLGIESEKDNFDALINEAKINWNHMSSIQYRQRLFLQKDQHKEHDFPVVFAIGKKPRTASVLSNLLKSKFSQMDSCTKKNKKREMKTGPVLLSLRTDEWELLQNSLIEVLVFAKGELTTIRGLPDILMWHKNSYLKDSDSIDVFVPPEFNQHAPPQGTSISLCYDGSYQLTSPTPGKTNRCDGHVLKTVQISKDHKDPEFVVQISYDYNVEQILRLLGLDNEPIVAVAADANLVEIPAQSNDVLDIPVQETTAKADHYGSEIVLPDNEACEEPVCVAYLDGDKSLMFAPVNFVWQTQAAMVFAIPKSKLRYDAHQDPIRIQRDDKPEQTEDVEADGNCFFRAISKVITGDSEEFHSTIRKKIVEFERKYHKELCMDKTDSGLEGYLSRMEKSGTWASQDEIFACATLLETSIFVYSSVGTVDKKFRWLHHGPRFSVQDGSMTVETYDEPIETEQGIYLFHINENHYRVVRQVESSHGNSELLSCVLKRERESVFDEEFEPPSKQLFLPLSDDVDAVTCSATEMEKLTTTSAPLLDDIVPLSQVVQTSVHAAAKEEHCCPSTSILLNEFNKLRKDFVCMIQKSGIAVSSKQALEKVVQDRLNEDWSTIRQLPDQQSLAVLDSVGVSYEFKKFIREYYWAMVRLPSSGQLEHVNVTCTLCNRLNVNRDGWGGGRVINVGKNSDLKAVKNRLRNHWKSHVAHEESYKESIRIEIAKKYTVSAVTETSPLAATARIVQVVYTLAKQGIPLRKHTPILEMISGFGVSIGQHFRSPVAAREIMIQISNGLQATLMDYISTKNPQFSLLLDSSTDLVGTVHVQLYIRFTVDHSPQTHFLTSQPMHERETGQAVFNMVKNYFQSAQRPSLNGQLEKRLVSVSTDGANVMKGGVGGFVGNLNRFLQQQRRESTFEILYVWCLAHRLELAIADGLTKDKQGKVFELRTVTTRLVNDIKTFFSNTAVKRQLYLRSAYEQHHKPGQKYFKLKRIMEVRWASSEKSALNNFLKMYPIIISACEKIGQEVSDSSKHKSNMFVFTLLDHRLHAYLIFEALLLEALSTYSVSLQVAEASAFDHLATDEQFRGHISQLYTEPWNNPLAIEWLSSVECLDTKNSIDKWMPMKEASKCREVYFEGYTGDEFLFRFSLNNKFLFFRPMDEVGSTRAQTKEIHTLKQAAVLFIEQTESEQKKKKAAATTLAEMDAVDQLNNIVSELRFLMLYGQERPIGMTADNRKKLLDSITTAVAERFSTANSLLGCFQAIGPHAIMGADSFSSANKECRKKLCEYFKLNAQKVEAQLEELKKSIEKLPAKYRDILPFKIEKPDVFFRKLWSLARKSDGIRINTELGALFDSVLTVAVSTSSVERGFSMMNILKQEKSSTMSDETLEARLRIIINGPNAQDYDATDVANIWIAKHMRADDPTKGRGPANNKNADEDDDELHNGEEPTDTQQLRRAFYSSKLLFVKKS